METQKIESFSIIGIAIRTSNDEGKATVDIPALWQKFMSEDILSKIPNKIDDTRYCIYTDYEKDFTKPYTTILGCKVQNLDTIPEGLIGRTFLEGKYTRFKASGNLMEGAVLNMWYKIWQTDFDRAYIADFEVYGEKAQNPLEAEVDIYISIK